MKKLLLLTFIFTAFTMNAQTSQGSIFVGANLGNAMVAGTGIQFASQDGESNLSLAVDGGYFVMDDLALLVGLGYSSNSAADSNAFSYRLGGKYYLMSKMPITLDYTGSSIKDADENPSWLGLGVGYALFLGDNVAIEPGLRYNLTMNDDFTEENVFQLNVGFSIFF